MDTHVGLSTLEKLCILYPGDVHDLASVWLRLRKARQLTGEPKCRPTVHGIAGVVAQLSGLSTQVVEDAMASQGVAPGWIVDFDENIARPRIAPDTRHS